MSSQATTESRQCYLDRLADELNRTYEFQRHRTSRPLRGLLPKSVQRTQISGAFNDLKFGLDQNALVIIPRLRYRFKHFNASSSVRVAALESGYWAVIDSTRQNCDLVILKDISHVVELIKSLVGEDGRIYATCLDGREVEIVTELADRIERILVRFLAEKKSNIARKQAALKKLLNQRPN